MKTVVWLNVFPNENIYVRMFNELGKERDLRLVMIVPEECKKYKFTNKNFEIRYLPVSNLGKILFFPLYLINTIRGIPNYDTLPSAAFKNLKQELDSLKPDVIIINTEYNIFSIQGAKYANKKNIPFILQTETKNVNSKIHKVYFKLYRLLFGRIIFKKSKYILPWTRDSLEFAKKNFSVHENKIILIPAGVDKKLFYEVRKRKNTPELKLLIIARFVPYKRYDLLIDALNYLKNELKISFRLSILGSGPLEKDIKTLIQKYHLQEDMVYLDRVPYEKLRNTYSENDIILLPSFNEAIGMVVPEAMACGTPAIVSNTAGANTYVVDGFNGYLFKSGDYKDLAKKIKLLQDRNKRETFGKHAKEHVLKNFEIKVVTKNFEKIIRSCLK